VGASKPEDYGGYYAWGETEEKSRYYWDTYIHCDGSSSTCHDIGKDIAGTQYDVAHVKWRGDWVMPNIEQIKELLHSCERDITISENGIDGCLFTGPTGASIFFPYSGYKSGNIIRAVGEYAGYWSSSIYNVPSEYHVWRLNFSSYNLRGDWNLESRYFGHSIRPVCKN
jgi:hypothetical protein